LLIVCDDLNVDESVRSRWRALIKVDKINKNPRDENASIRSVASSHEAW